MVINSYEEYMETCIKILNSSRGKVRVSTFNLFVNDDLTKRFLKMIPAKSDFIVGINYTMCEQGCSVCTAKAINKSNYLFKMKEMYGFAITEKHHMKYFQRGNLALIGGFNISGSGYTDMAILIEDKQKIKEMNSIFDIAYKEVKNDLHLFEAETEEPIFTFGKYKGRKVEDVYKEDEDYIFWALDNLDENVLERLRLRDYE